MALLPLLYALFFVYEIRKIETGKLLIFLDSQRNSYAINEFCINR